MPVRELTPEESEELDRRKAANAPIVQSMSISSYLRRYSNPENPMEQLCEGVGACVVKLVVGNQELEFLCVTGERRDRLLSELTASGASLK